ERRAHVRRGKRVVERDGPWQARRLSITAAREKASEAADRVAERDPPRGYIARRPQRQAFATDIRQGDRHSEYQPPVEDAARARQGQQLTRIVSKGIEVRDEKQDFRADQGADDDVDAEVEDAGRIELAGFRAPHGPVGTG